MSQVRKLLQGAVIKAEEGAKPKQPKGGKYWKNGLYVAEGEDVYRQLAEYLAGKEFDNVRDFANDFLKWYGEGNEFSSSGVYHNYSPTFKPEGWGKNGSYIGKSAGKLANTDKSRFYTFGQLLNAFNYVAPKEEKIEEPEKKSFDTSEITLDYNQTTDKKKYKWSDTALGNEKAVKRVLDAIEALKDPDNSGYKLSDDLRAWYNIKGDKNLEYANAMWDDLRSDNWDKSTNLGAYEDWLAPLGIKLFKAPAIEGNPKPKGRSGGAGGGNSEYIVGQIYTRADGTKAKYLGNGKWEAVVENTDEDSQEQEIVVAEPSSTSSKITLIKPGDRDDMDWGVSYQDDEGNIRVYSADSIDPSSDIGLEMAKFAENNARMQTQADRYNNSTIKIPSIKDYKDWMVGETLDDGTDLNPFFLSRGITSAAMSFLGRDSDGNRYFKYFDNYTPGGTYIPNGGTAPKENPWNIRSPYYLMINKDGSISALSNEPSDAMFENGQIQSSAPSFKTLRWDPTTAITTQRRYAIEEPNVPRTMGYNWSPSVTVRKPGKLIYRIGNTNIYRTKDGFMDDEGSYYSPEQLYKLLRKLHSTKKKSIGGKIDSKKVNTLIAKHGAKVVKAQNPAKGVFDVTFDDSLGLYDTNKYWQDLYNKNFPGIQLTSGLEENNPMFNRTLNKSFGSFEAKPLEYDPVYASKKATTETEKPEEESAEQPEMPYGGDTVDPYASARGAMMFGNDALRLGMSLLASKMKRDNNIKMAKDSVIAPSSLYFHGYSTAMPVETAKLAHVQNLISRNPLNTISINDPVVQAAIIQNGWAQLFPEEEKGYRAMSDKWSAIEQANVGVTDKRSAADVERVNKLKELQRAAVGMIGSAKDQHIEEVAESLENFSLQERQKMQTANDVITKAETARDSSNFVTQQNEEKKNVYTSLGVTAAYNKAKDRTSYLDEEDWLWNSNSDKAKAFRIRLESKKKQWDQELENKMAALALKREVSPMYRPYIPAELKKSGGKVRNRYKNEPWEDIWIHQNKATHAQVARLSDNIIKLFLKTLK